MRRLQVRGLTSEATHLAARFLGFLVAEPLTPSEQRFVREALTPALADVFYRQRMEDQRHAVDVAHRVGPHPERIEAALVHDVGKSASRLGAVGRSSATILDHLGLPLPASWMVYREHGAIGADLIRDADGGELAIAFARFHPGPVPPGIDADDWHALAEADGA